MTNYNNERNVMIEQYNGIGGNRGGGLGEA
jgi:hypothetical protein